jgi:hypothetical protein
VEKKKYQVILHYFSSSHHHALGQAIDTNVKQIFRTFGIASS